MAGMRQMNNSMFGVDKGEGAQYLADEDVTIDDSKFGMWVLPIANAVEVTSRDGDLPCHEDLQKEGLLVQYDPRTMNKCLFFSHTWLRNKHPDNEAGVKKALMNSILHGICKSEVAFHAYWFASVVHYQKDKPPQQVSADFAGGFVWLDWWAIPQHDPASQGLAIQSIPTYVACTHAFIVLAGPWVHENGSVRDLLAWNGRGWCRMEQVCNALSPIVKPVICATSASSVKNFGPAEVLGRMWFNEVVGRGAFAVEADKYALRTVIQRMIQRRQATALRAGSLLWFRVLQSLTTQILAGTEPAGSADEEAPPPLAEWLKLLRFESIYDGVKDGHTPLRYAVIEGRVDLVKEILQAQPRVDVHAPLKKAGVELMFNLMPKLTLLHQAAMSQHGEASGEIITLLLDAKANPRSLSADQRWTPLHLACTSDNRAAITALMKHDPTLCKMQIIAGVECFQRCAIGGSHTTMRWIIEQYPSYVLPQLKGLAPCGMSWPLAAVFEENSAEMLELLLEHGANLNVDDGSWLPAMVKKNVLLRNIFPLIMRNGSRAKKPSGLIGHFGFCLRTTPLHVAAFTGNLRSLDVLLRNGAVVEGPRTTIHWHKCSPLHCAAAGGHDAIVDRLLLANPAFAYAKDRYGKTAAWWAERRGHSRLAQKLEKAASASGASVGADQPPDSAGRSAKVVPE